MHEDRKIFSFERLAEEIGRIEGEWVDRPRRPECRDLKEAESVRISVEARSLAVQSKTLRPLECVNQCVRVLGTLDVRVVHGGPA